jgi:energy-coupling factor transporter ATP-binding protein EcfA2
MSDRTGMSTWEDYPSDYRSSEVREILSALKAGECVSVVGLSGSGKSNLLGFMAHRQELLAPCPRLVLIDCNRLPGFTPQALFGLMAAALAPATPSIPVDLGSIETRIKQELKQTSSICFLFDRFEALAGGREAVAGESISSNLRALRDAFKYSLTYVTATRRPIDPTTELAELFYANTLWLGPMNASDGRWNVERYAQRKGLVWDLPTKQAILRLSGAYPALFRAVCEAHAAGAALNLESLRQHPAVVRRVAEFWADQPSQEDLQRSRLGDNPLLASRRTPGPVDEAQLTAKEYLLWDYFFHHPDQVCEKDELIRAVWPEDRIFESGVRDDSLAQLVRRLREKIEPAPSSPRYIQTIPGRGYRYTP